MPVARDDKYHMSSERPDSGSLGLQRYFNSRADGRVIARTPSGAIPGPFKVCLLFYAFHVINAENSRDFRELVRKRLFFIMNRNR